MGASYDKIAADGARACAARRNAYALMRVLTTRCEFQQVTINGVLFLREPLTAAFAAGACFLGPRIVLVNPR